MSRVWTRYATCRQGIERSEDVVALIMMVMAASISGYALFAYLKRSKMLKDQVEEVSVAAPPQPCRRRSCLPCAYRTSASDITPPDQAHRCLSLHEITNKESVCVIPPDCAARL